MLGWARRAAEASDEELEVVVFDAAGGRHSRIALRLARRMAGPLATAFVVEPDADEVSREVGQRRLEKALKRAGVEEGRISTKVALGDEISQEIRREAEEGDSEL